MAEDQNQGIFARVRQGEELFDLQDYEQKQVVIKLLPKLTKEEIAIITAE